MASASYHVGEVTVTLNIDSGRASKREGPSFESLLGFGFFSLTRARHEKIHIFF